MDACAAHNLTMTQNLPDVSKTVYSDGLTLHHLTYKYYNLLFRWRSGPFGATSRPKSFTGPAPERDEGLGHQAADTEAKRRGLYDMQNC